MVPRRRPKSLLHAMDRQLEQAIITKLNTEAPLAEAPPDVRSLIVADVRLEFGSRRFTFLQLLKHAFTIPELAWWVTDPRGQELHNLMPIPGEDVNVYRPERANPRSQDEAAEIAVHALRDSGFWEIQVIPYGTDDTPHIVFAPRSAPQQD